MGGSSSDALLEGAGPDRLCPHRAQSLHSARTAYDNYRSGYDHLLQFLSNIPSYEPQETDSLSQMETKLKNQKVGQLRPSVHPCS